MIEVFDRELDGGERDKLADLVFKQAVLALGNNGNTLPVSTADRAYPNQYCTTARGCCNTSG